MYVLNTIIAIIIPPMNGIILKCFNILYIVLWKIRDPSRMFAFLKTDAYDVIFSIVIGIGLVAVFKPGCRDKGCAIKKAPPVDEVTKTTYQIGEKCYKFKVENIECPLKGAIEPFEVAPLRAVSY